MPRGGKANFRGKIPKKGERFGGRAKGTPNKITVSMKEAVLGAFNDMGGQAAFVKWGNTNLDTRKAFYSIAARLIPTELVGKDGADLIPSKTEVHVYLPDNGRISVADKKAKQ
jgi:hypothetical protein